MDFIERWFGLSPDGGNGSLELVYMATAVVVVAGFAFRHRLRNWWARKSAA